MTVLGQGGCFPAELLGSLHHFEGRSEAISEAEGRVTMKVDVIMPTHLRKPFLRLQQLLSKSDSYQS